MTQEDFLDRWKTLIDLDREMRDKRRKAVMTPRHSPYCLFCFLSRYPYSILFVCLAVSGFLLWVLR